MRTNRTWATCLQDWENYKEKLRNSADPLVRKIFYEPINKGIKWPMIGICLSIEEYQRFVAEGRRIEDIMGYCESGKQTHEDVRLAKNVGMSTIGLTTPRNGFYKVVAVSGDDITCYYNHDRGDAFLDETVEISSKPLYNKASVGPKAYRIKAGDIIKVEDVDLVELTYNGNPYSTYKIIWDFYKQ